MIILLWFAKYHLNIFFRCSSVKIQLISGFTSIIPSTPTPRYKGVAYLYYNHFLNIVLESKYQMKHHISDKTNIIGCFMLITFSSLL